MRIAVMQPYLLSYLGYFQLLYAADVFVLLDDVQFITRGWINRNRILVGEREHLFTVPLEQASQNKLIQQIHIQAADLPRRKLLRTIEQAYKKAPYFPTCFPLLERILLTPPSLRIVDMVRESILIIAHYLGWEPTLQLSSALPKASGLGATDRILAICAQLGADEYINMEGGGHLYSSAVFAQHDIQLLLLRAHLPPYPQGKFSFVPGLSMIDVLMHNSPAWIRRSLAQYKVL